MNIRLQFLAYCACFALLLTACNRADLPDPLDALTERNAPAFLALNYTTAPINNIDGAIDYRFAADIPYSLQHQRNVLDIFTLAKAEPTPLVVFIHSGGFVRGDKKEAYGFERDIEQFLAAGIAFASINYRFLEQTNNGVLGSLEDSKRAIQFLRYHAKSFNIDPKRIACFGVSAGAGASLWLATHDDMAVLNSRNPIDRMSTRIQSAVALGTQASYDLLQWEEIFRAFNFSLTENEENVEALSSFYPVEDVSELYQAEMIDYRERVDMLQLMSEEDAAIYAFNPGSAQPPANEGELYHHPFHVLALQERAEAVGLEHQAYAPGLGLMSIEGETPVAFTIRKLLE
ncbi:MAG: alpha/beta hydrolase [Bacteroidota bacterium]